MRLNIQKIDHIQICIPPNCEDQARKFYLEILQFKEIEKPEELKKNGGFWLEIANIQLHIGIEVYSIKSKRHPAFEVIGLEEIKNYLIKHKVKIKEEIVIIGQERFSFFDPFDNRIEFLEYKN